MKWRRASRGIVALAVTVSLPLLGLSGVASAKGAKGCHKTHSCRSGGGSPTGSGTGAAPAPITVQIDPNPLVETGQSDILATVQVEAAPSLAGIDVNISSSQLVASCAMTSFLSIENNSVGGPGNITAGLDDDGNVTVIIFGEGCAPGSDVIEADLEAAPYDTALGTLVASPPVVTPSGVYGYPTSSGTVTTGEVETANDSDASHDSDVYAVFYVETSPVYAEQPVEISSDELESRCGGIPWNLGSVSDPPGETGLGGTVGPPAQGILDDDGNAAFYFFGASCAAGSSEVIADVEAGSHPTYTTTFTIDPPQPTI